MHLVIPFAATLSSGGVEALSALRLPHLERLLAHSDADPGAAGACASASEDDAPEFTLNTPHERVLAHLRGWSADDGRLPFAATLAQGDGIEIASAAPGDGWGLLTPSHWHVGAEQVSLADPAALDLQEDESRQLHEALRPLFADGGWQWHWGAPLRWYASHASLADMPTASLDRVIGRSVDLWLQGPQALRSLRRLQAEAQMLLHTHPVNEAREARGLLPVNSFWLSGTGPGAPAATALPPGVLVDERLRAPALAEDWPAWSAAWQALDALLVSELADAAPGTPISLTLCGERSACRLDRRPHAGWSRLFGPRRRPALPLLRAL